MRESGNTLRDGDTLDTPVVVAKPRYAGEEYGKSGNESREQNRVPGFKLGDSSPRCQLSQPLAVSETLLRLLEFSRGLLFEKASGEHSSTLEVCPLL